MPVWKDGSREVIIGVLSAVRQYSRLGVEMRMRRVLSAAKTPNINMDIETRGLGRCRIEIAAGLLDRYIMITKF